MKKYALNPLTNRFVEVGKYKYKRLIKSGVIKPYVDNPNKEYTISTDEYIKFLKYKRDNDLGLGNSKNKSKINLKKNDEKIEQKSDINLIEKEKTYQYNGKKENEEDIYQYNNKEEKEEEKTLEKTLEKPVDLEESNFDEELQKLISLELECPSTDSDEE